MSVSRLAVVISVLGDRLVDRLGPSARRAPVRSGWVATTPIVKRLLTKMLLATLLVLAYWHSRYHAEAVGAACADVISFCEILDRETTEAGSVRLAAAEDGHAPGKRVFKTANHALNPGRVPSRFRSLASDIAVRP